MGLGKSSLWAPAEPTHSKMTKQGRVSFAVNLDEDGVVRQRFHQARRSPPNQAPPGAAQPAQEGQVALCLCVLLQQPWEHSASFRHTLLLCALAATLGACLTVRLNESVCARARVRACLILRPLPSHMLPLSLYCATGTSPASS